MGTELKKKEKTLPEWYNSLDTLAKRNFRKELIKVSGMQAPTFYSKMQRNCSFTPLEQKAIQEIIGEGVEIIFPTSIIHGKIKRNPSPIQQQKV